MANSVTVTIGGVSYTPEIPFTFVIDKSEAFDFGEMIIKHTTVEEAFTEGTDIEITVNAVTFEFIVDIDTSIKVNNGIYNHTVRFIEVTSKLSKYIPADRFFTVSSIGGRLKYNYHLEVLQNTPLNAPTFAFNIPTATDTFLNVNAVQKKYQNMNLLQSLIELFRSVDAVPRLRLNDNLEYTLYNDKNLPITIGEITGQTKRKDFANYALSVKTKAKNLTYDGDIQVAATFFPDKSYGVKPRSDGRYSDSKAKYIIDKDIRRIIIATILDNPLTGSRTHDLDISNYIVPKIEWDGLELGSNVLTTLYTQGPKQRNTLYYTIGDNEIVNLGTNIESDGVFSDFDVMEAVIKSALNDDNTYFVSDYSSQPIKDYKLRIFYQPYFEGDITVTRNVGVTKGSTILSNQKDTIVDLGRYLNVLKGIVNKLSNGDYEFTKKHSAIAECFQLGDYTADNFQITKISYEVFPNHLNATYGLTKNFINTNADTSVTNRPTPYTIQRDNVNTNFVDTKYIELSATSKTLSTYFTQAGVNALMNGMSFTASHNTPIYVSQFFSIDTVGLASNQRIQSSTLCIGDSTGIRLFTGFKEPKIAGIQNITETVALGKDPQAGSPFGYTDAGGGMETAELNFFNTGAITEANFPVVAEKTTDILISTPVNQYDLQPNEIFGYTGEFLFASDSRIIVSDKMGTENSLVKEINLPDVMTVYVSSPDTVYDIYDKIAKETVSSSTSITINKTLRSIDVSAVTGTSTATWALGDENGNLYFAVNYTGSSLTTIYINVINNKTGISKL